MDETNQQSNMALVVIDTQREKIAIAEANRLGIPVVGIVDTKCDPDPIDYVIPANDDAIKTARLLFNVLSSAVWEGRQQYMKAAGIEIPYEKRDLYVKELPEAFGQAG